MEYLLLVFIIINSIYSTKCEDTVKLKNKCNIDCPPGDEEMVCGFEPELKKYGMFASKCAMTSFSTCHNFGYIESPLKFCIKNIIKPFRRYYGDSCPAFCPSHYRPVCGASKIRSYNYRAFNNGCYFDMLNCRGHEDSGYIEVPLHFCQKHAMKNIFKEQVVISRFDNYKDYNDY